jgi:predicted RNA-binding Zn ribbon-like protein
MNATETAANEQKLVGGSLCIDFINSLDGRASTHPTENLTSYAALVAWGQHATILNEDEAAHLLATAAARQSEASDTLEAAIAFRETLYRILTAVLANGPPAEHDLNNFNRARAQALAHSAIVATGEGFAWRWKSGEHDLDRMLWPIIHSAAELLLSPDLKLVKECSGPDCGWLFLDTSKNHTRRWCTMESCGNRAKARGHYQRIRHSASARDHPEHLP